MAFRMASPWKNPKTGMYWFRKRVPDVLRPKVGKTILQITLETKDRQEALSRFHKVALDVDAEWRALLAERSPLTDAQIDGICGEFGRWLVEQHELDPGAREKWEKQLAFERTVAGPKARRVGGAGAIYMPEIKRFLAERDIVIVDGWDLFRLSAAAAKSGGIAKETLLRRASRDYKHDPRIDTEFPDWKKIEPTLLVSSRMLTVAGDWEKYAKEANLGPSTIKSYKPKLEKLTKFVGKANLADITPKQVVAWKDHLFAQELDPKTGAECYFAAARSFFKWAINNQKATSNPFADIHIKIPKKPKLRPKSLQEDEAGLILSESLLVHETRASEEFVTAKRWIPWIMAYTGARVNEITQIRGSDLTLRKVKVETAPAVRRGPKAKHRIDDVWVLNLTPQAGRIKTGEAREVPLHPHLVEQGFPEFVKKRGDGPVFYDPSLRRDGADENPQFQKVADQLADWVREIGVDDENVAPNHGWRHRFNRVARIARMDPEVRDAIKGHKPRTEGEAYGDEMPIEAKWVEILRLPSVEVAAPSGDRPGVERRKVKSRARMATAKRAKEQALAAKAKKSGMPPKLARKAHLLLAPIDDEPQGE